MQGHMLDFVSPGVCCRQLAMACLTYSLQGTLERLDIGVHIQQRHEIKGPTPSALSMCARVDMLG